MTIKVHTVLDEARERAAFFRNMSADRVAGLSQLAADRRQRMLALPAAPTAEQLRAALGYGLLYGLLCANCEREVDAVVELGEEPDYESSTARVCEACLVAALAALRGESKHE